MVPRVVGSNPISHPFIENDDKGVPSKGSVMPTISMFFGIIVRMYCGKAEHNPPHIHVYYQDRTAIFDVATAE